MNDKELIQSLLDTLKAMSDSLNYYYELLEEKKKIIEELEVAIKRLS